MPEKWWVEYLNDLGKKTFYGKVTLQYENSKIVLIRKEETIKPPKQDNRKGGSKKDE